LRMARVGNHKRNAPLVKVTGPSGDARVRLPRVDVPKAVLTSLRRCPARMSIGRSTGRDDENGRGRDR
jgi:hypothetical protein